MSFKQTIRKWLGITEEVRPILFQVEHPDSLEIKFTHELKRHIAGFFKGSAPGRILVSNLYQDINELMQKASSTPHRDLRDYLLCKAEGQREQLAKILTLCVIHEEKELKSDEPVNQDEISAALGHEYEIGDES